MSLAPLRKIIHVDMDAFYASVEQRDEPNFRNRPVVVGGKPNSRGVVAACSYEARKFGIHSAMPCSKAYRLCPDVIFTPPRFDVYREVSSQIHEIFSTYTTRIEPLSLDEAYLDVSDAPYFQGSATRIAAAIREQILKTTGLTASAGVSYNKFLAKIASDMDKPNGLTVILPEQGIEFISLLAIGRFYGIGKVTEAKMHALGIKNGENLRAFPIEELKAHFGKAANYYFHIARGIDERPVENRGERKSIGSETTFADDLIDTTEMLIRLNQLGQKVCSTLEDKELAARTLTIKVKYSDFQQVTRSITLEDILISKKVLKLWIPVLLEKTLAGEKPVRLLGITVSNLCPICETVDQRLLI